VSATAENPYRIHRFSVADYNRLGEIGLLTEDDRVELIDGEIIDMPPISSRHAGTVGYLNDQLFAAVGGQAIVRVQNPIFSMTSASLNQTSHCCGRGMISTHAAIRAPMMCCS
jgi:hypothetical protein